MQGLILFIVIGVNFSGKTLKSEVRCRTLHTIDGKKNMYREEMATIDILCPVVRKLEIVRGETTSKPSGKHRNYNCVRRTVAGTLAFILSGLNHPLNNVISLCWQRGKLCKL